MSEIIGFLINVLPKEIKDNLFLGIVGLAGVVIEKTFVFLKNYIKNIDFARKNQGFTISGTWLAAFSSYFPGKHNYELVKIDQEQEKIRFYIEQYNNFEENNFLKVEGSGVFRASKVSATYYPLDPSVGRSGVFVLRTITSNGGVLKGKYIEFESTEKGDILHNDENYTLKRINLPLMKRIKMKLNKPCFKNFDDLEVFLQKKYLFNWDKIPGVDSEILKQFLIKKFGIDWIQTANIEKIDDGKTIKLSAGTKHVLLEHYEKTKVNIKIDDVRTDELIVEPENSNIYQRINKMRK